MQMTRFQYFETSEMWKSQWVVPVWSITWSVLHIVHVCVGIRFGPIILHDRKSRERPFIITVSGNLPGTWWELRRRCGLIHFTYRYCTSLNASRLQWCWWGCIILQIAWRWRMWNDLPIKWRYVPVRQLRVGVHVINQVRPCTKAGWCPRHIIVQSSGLDVSLASWSMWCFE